MREAYPGKYDTKYKDVMACIALKAGKAFRNLPPNTKGQAFMSDAVKLTLKQRVDLVITSPPYFSAHTYAYDNRHRLWFLGHDYQKVQQDMFQESNQTEYSKYIIECLKNIQTTLNDNTACVLVVGDVEMTIGGEKEIVETGDQLVSKWSDTKNTEMEVERIILDSIPLKSRRYIHVPVTKGIKQERIVIFHKGKPKVKEPWIDWTQRPQVATGPNWASMYE